MKITNIALLIEHSVNVIDSLNRGLRLTIDEQYFLCEHFERREFKKNDFVIEVGDYENYFYFMENGILRHWTYSNQEDPFKEITFWFSFPGEFVDSFLALKTHQPSLINIQALTDCVIWRLSKEKLTLLYDISLNMNKIVRIAMEDTLARKTVRETLLLGFSSEVIYRDLLVRERKIIENVPLKYIASYIGVTPQRLSQIRKMVYKSNF